MKRLKRIALSAFAAVLTFAIMLPSNSVFAQSSASLSIVPRKNYVIEAGKSINDTLTIRNLDAERSLELTLRVVDFTFKDDSGTPLLMLDEDAPQTTWSLKPYIDVPKSVTIGPKASQTLNMSVAIPEGHGAGALYSAIVYSSGAPEGGNVGLSASGVTLAFVNVPGKVDEKLTLEKFGAYHTAQSGRDAGYVFFATDEPQTIGYTLKNEGNVTEAPVGSITIKSIFGKEYVINNINPNSSLALIGQTRTFTPCIKLKSEEVDFNGARAEATTCTSPGLWPGIYTATLTMFYGQNGNNTNEVNSTAIFWYFPWWSILLLIAITGVIIWAIYKITRRFRRSSYQMKSRQSLRRK